MLPSDVSNRIEVEDRLNACCAGRRRPRIDDDSSVAAIMRCDDVVLLMWLIPTGVIRASFTGHQDTWQDTRGYQSGESSLVHRGKFYQSSKPTLTGIAVDGHGLIKSHAIADPAADPHRFNRRCSHREQTEMAYIAAHRRMGDGRCRTRITFGIAISQPGGWWIGGSIRNPGNGKWSSD